MDFNCNINTGEFGEFLTQNVLNIFYSSGSDNFKVNHGCIKMRCFLKKKDLFKRENYYELLLFIYHFYKKSFTGTCLLNTF